MTFDHGPGGDALAVTRYHDGDMSPAEEKAFDNHLDGCDACRTLLRQAVVLLPALDDALGPPPLSEAQREALLERLRAPVSPVQELPKPEKKTSRPGPHWARRVAIGVLAAAAVAAALAFFSRSNTQTIASPHPGPRTSGP